ncbi:MAG: hypothetical protein GEU93_10215 [Propionibacteriales bacterium]|nr:hypothetical protein [Propionibacteriales bacterium]
MRSRLIAGVTCLALVSSACGIPYRKDTDDLTKVAASDSQARRIIAEFNLTRQEADTLLDGSLLPDIESGSLLDIDQGAYFVAARVAGHTAAARLRLEPPDEVLSPRFAGYPMWFVAVSRDAGGDTQRVVVFERQDSVSPWLMTMAPEISGDTELPAMELDRGDAVVTAPPDSARGVAMSGSEALSNYAAALTGEDAPENDLFVDDDFLRRTREFQRSQRSLPFADFTQSWSAEPASLAMRVAGGGLLVFGTLERADAYSVHPSSYIDWGSNADAKAYLPGRALSAARLDYRHQVLLFVPPRGEGEAQLIGQYGGVVDGSGS